MKKNTILTCAIVALSFVQTLGQEYNNQPSQAVQRTISGVVGTLNTAGQCVVDVLKTPIQGVPILTKDLVNTLGGTLSHLLNGSAQILKRAVGTVADATGIIPLPGLSLVANTGKEAINAALDITNAAGQSATAASAGLLNAVADGTHGLTELAANLAKGSMNVGADLVTSSMNAGADLVQGSLDVGADLVKGSMGVGADLAKGSMGVGADLAKGSMDLGADLANSAVNTGVNAASSGIESIGETLDQGAAWAQFMAELMATRSST